MANYYQKVDVPEVEAPPNSLPMPALDYVEAVHPRAPIMVEHLDNVPPEVAPLLHHSDNIAPEVGPIFQHPTIIHDVAVNNPIVFSCGFTLLVLYLVGLVIIVQRTKKTRSTVILLHQYFEKTGYPYVIVIGTGHRHNSGTYGSVQINLRGSYGNSGFIRMSSPRFRRENILQLGNMDLFLSTSDENLGEIRSIDVEFSNKDPHHEFWYLSFIEIHDLGQEKSFYFPCHAWLLASRLNSEKVVLKAVSETVIRMFITQFLRNFCHYHLYFMLCSWKRNVSSFSTGLTLTLIMSVVLWTMFTNSIIHSHIPHDFHIELDADLHTHRAFAMCFVLSTIIFTFHLGMEYILRNIRCREIQKPLSQVESTTSSLDDFYDVIEEAKGSELEKTLRKGSKERLLGASNNNENNNQIFGYGDNNLTSVTTSGSSQHANFNQSNSNKNLFFSNVYGNINQNNMETNELIPESHWGLPRTVNKSSKTMNLVIDVWQKLRPSTLDKEDIHKEEDKTPKEKKKFRFWNKDKKEKKRKEKEKKKRQSPHIEINKEKQIFYDMLRVQVEPIVRAAAEAAVQELYGINQTKADLTSFKKMILRILEGYAVSKDFEVNFIDENTTGDEGDDELDTQEERKSRKSLSTVRLIDHQKRQHATAGFTTSKPAVFNRSLMDLRKCGTNIPGSVGPIAKALSDTLLPRVAQSSLVMLAYQVSGILNESKSIYSTIVKDVTQMDSAAKENLSPRRVLYSLTSLVSQNLAEKVYDKENDRAAYLNMLKKSASWQLLNNITNSNLQKIRPDQMVQTAVTSLHGITNQENEDVVQDGIKDTILQYLGVISDDMVSVMFTCIWELVRAHHYDPEAKLARKKKGRFNFSNGDGCKTRRHILSDEEALSPGQRRKIKSMPEVLDFVTEMIGQQIEIVKSMKRDLLKATQGWMYVDTIIFNAGLQAKATLLQHYKAIYPLLPKDKSLRRFSNVSSQPSWTPSPDSSKSYNKLQSAFKKEMFGDRRVSFSDEEGLRGDRRRRSEIMDILDLPPIPLDISMSRLGSDPNHSALKESEKEFVRRASSAASSFEKFEEQCEKFDRRLSKLLPQGSPSMPWEEPSSGSLAKFDSKLKAQGNENFSNLGKCDSNSGTQHNEEFSNLGKFDITSNNQGNENASNLGKCDSSESAQHDDIFSNLSKIDSSSNNLGNENASNLGKCDSTSSTQQNMNFSNLGKNDSPSNVQGNETFPKLGKIDSTSNTQGNENFSNASIKIYPVSSSESDTPSLHVNKDSELNLTAVEEVDSSEEEDRHSVTAAKSRVQISPRVPEETTKKKMFKPATPLQERRSLREKRMTIKESLRRKTAKGRSMKDFDDSEVISATGTFTSASTYSTISVSSSDTDSAVLSSRYSGDSGSEVSVGGSLPSRKKVGKVKTAKAKMWNLWKKKMSPILPIKKPKGVRSEISNITEESSQKASASEGESDTSSNTDSETGSSRETLRLKENKKPSNIKQILDAFSAISLSGIGGNDLDQMQKCQSDCNTNFFQQGTKKNFHKRSRSLSPKVDLKPLRLELKDDDVSWNISKDVAEKRASAEQTFDSPKRARLSSFLSESLQSNISQTSLGPEFIELEDVVMHNILSTRKNHKYWNPPGSTLAKTTKKQTQKHPSMIHTKRKHSLKGKEKDPVCMYKKHLMGENYREASTTTLFDLGSSSTMASSKRPSHIAASLRSSDISMVSTISDNAPEFCLKEGERSQSLCHLSPAKTKKLSPVRAKEKLIVTTEETEETAEETAEKATEKTPEKATEKATRKTKGKSKRRMTHANISPKETFTTSRQRRSSSPNPQSNTVKPETTQRRSTAVSFLERLPIAKWPLNRKQEQENTHIPHKKKFGKKHIDTKKSDDAKQADDVNKTEDVKKSGAVKKSDNVKKTANMRTMNSLIKSETLIRLDNKSPIEHLSEKTESKSSPKRWSVASSSKMSSFKTVSDLEEMIKDDVFRANVRRYSSSETLIKDPSLKQSSSFIDEINMSSNHQTELMPSSSCDTVESLWSLIVEKPSNNKVMPNNPQGGDSDSSDTDDNSSIKRNINVNNPKKSSRVPVRVQESFSSHCLRYDQIQRPAFTKRINMCLYDSFYSLRSRNSNNSNRYNDVQYHQVPTNESPSDSDHDNQTSPLLGNSNNNANGNDSDSPSSQQNSDTSTLQSTPPFSPNKAINAQTQDQLYATSSLHSPVGSSISANLKSCPKRLFDNDGSETRRLAATVTSEQTISTHKQLGEKPSIKSDILVKPYKNVMQDDRDLHRNENAHNNTTLSPTSAIIQELKEIDRFLEQYERDEINKGSDDECEMSPTSTAKKEISVCSMSPSANMINLENIYVEPKPSSDSRDCSSQTPVVKRSSPGVKKETQRLKKESVSEHSLSPTKKDPAKNYTVTRNCFMTSGGKWQCQRSESQALPSRPKTDIHNAGEGNVNSSAYLYLRGRLVDSSSDSSDTESDTSQESSEWNRLNHIMCSGYFTSLCCESSHQGERFSALPPNAEGCLRNFKPNDNDNNNKTVCNYSININNQNDSKQCFERPLDTASMIQSKVDPKGQLFNLLLNILVATQERLLKHGKKKEGEEPGTEKVGDSLKYSVMMQLPKIMEKYYCRWIVSSMFQYATVYLEEGLRQIDPQRLRFDQAYMCKLGESFLAGTVSEHLSAVDFVVQDLLDRVFHRASYSVVEDLVTILKVKEFDKIVAEVIEVMTELDKTGKDMADIGCEVPDIGKRRLSFDLVEDVIDANNISPNRLKSLLKHTSCNESFNPEDDFLMPLSRAVDILLDIKKHRKDLRNCESVKNMNFQNCGRFRFFCSEMEDLRLRLLPLGETMKASESGILKRNSLDGSALDNTANVGPMKRNSTIIDQLLGMPDPAPSPKKSEKPQKKKDKATLPLHQNRHNSKPDAPAKLMIESPRQKSLEKFYRSSHNSIPQDSSENVLLNPNPSTVEDDKSSELEEFSEAGEATRHRSSSVSSDQFYTGDILLRNVERQLLKEYDKFLPSYMSYVMYFVLLGMCVSALVGTLVMGSELDEKQAVSWLASVVAGLCFDILFLQITKVAVLSIVRTRYDSSVLK